MVRAPRPVMMRIDKLQRVAKLVVAGDLGVAIDMRKGEVGGGAEIRCSPRARVQQQNESAREPEEAPRSSIVNGVRHPSIERFRERIGIAVSSDRAEPAARMSLTAILPSRSQKCSI